MILVDIRNEDDIYYALHCVRFLIKELPFNETEKQSISVTVLELTRNIIQHGGGKGTLYCELQENGIKMTAADEGPGIANPEDILNGRFQSAKGLGLGLAGTKRLMDEFTLESSTKGTIIHVAKRISGNRRR